MELRNYVLISCIFLSLFVHVKCCDERNCVATTGTICNNQGSCECGVCTCNNTYSGPTCEECPSCPTPCEIYQDCVGCKIFGTGPLGTVECMDKCDKIVTLLPVYDTKEFESLSSGRKIVCQNVVKMGKYKYCMEMFMVGEMRDGFRDLHCYTEQDCSEKYIPTDPPIPEVTLDIKEDEGKTGTGSNKNPEEAGAVSGTNEGQTGDGNGTSTLSFSWIFIATVLSLYL